MNARENLYAALMTDGIHGRGHTPDRSEQASALLDAHHDEIRRDALMEGAAIAAEVSTDSPATAATRATVVAALRVAALTNDECAQCAHRRGDHLNHGAFCTLPTSETTVCGCRRYAHPDAR